MAPISLWHDQFCLFLSLLLISANPACLYSHNNPKEVCSKEKLIEYPLGLLWLRRWERKPFFRTFGWSLCPLPTTELANYASQVPTNEGTKKRMQRRIFAVDSPRFQGRRNHNLPTFSRPFGDLYAPSFYWIASSCTLLGIKLKTPHRVSNRVSKPSLDKNRNFLNISEDMCNSSPFLATRP